MVRTSFLGLDLAPTWQDRVDIPDNAVFELCYVAEGIPCPDETLHIVHPNILGLELVESSMRCADPRAEIRTPWS
jgi:hypothetical protein